MDAGHVARGSDHGRWQLISLASRYAMASAVVLGLAALAVEWGVVRLIEDGVVRNTGRDRGRGGDDSRSDDRSRDDNGRRPRVPGGSGCDDTHDIAEHPECRI